MINFKQFLTEQIDEFQDQIKQDNEREFIRTIAKIFNIVNDFGDRTTKPVKSNVPVNIILGRDFEINNVIQVIHVAHDTVDSKKADVILITSDKKKIPISLKDKTSSTYSKTSKFEFIGNKLKKHLMLKGIDYTISIPFDVPDEWKEEALFGSDLKPLGGCIFKGEQTNFEQVDKNTFRIDGKVITSLKDLSPQEYPVLRIVGNKRPEIVTRTNVGMNKKIIPIPKAFTVDNK